MKVLKHVTLLILVLSTAQVAKGSFCEGTFFTGKSVPEIPEYPDLPVGAKVSFLGGGGFGSVYRVQVSDNESFNVKVYHEVDLRGDFDSGANHPKTLMGIDIESLQSLNEFPEYADAPFPPWFRTVKVSPGKHPNTLVLEDVKGWTINDFLEHPGIPKERKDVVAARYVALHAYFDADTSVDIARKPEYNFSSGEYQLLGYAMYNIFPESAILLKANNILVESATLDLVMIDPF